MLTTRLAAVRPAIEPTARPKIIQPMSPTLIPNDSRMDGVLVIQVASPAPERANITNSALRSARSLGVTVTSFKVDLTQNNDPKMIIGASVGMRVEIGSYLEAIKTLR